jgi:phosphoglycerate kinase
MPNATGKTRAIRIDELQRGASYGYFLDVAASSFEDETVKSALRGAKSIFINAVMGFTSSGFHEGTSALDHAIAENKEARKYFGGGDTIQEFKSLSPALYLAAAYDPTFYLFTGGGTVLKALELGGADKLETVRCIMADDDEKVELAEEPRCKAFADCAC